MWICRHLIKHIDVTAPPLGIDTQQIYPNQLLIILAFYYVVSTEELHSLCRSANIVRVIKPRRSRWAGHVARMEEGRSAFKILTGKPAGKPREYNWVAT